MRVRWTSRAAKHLSEALDYIAKENPGAEYGVGKRIFEAQSLIGQHPKVGRYGLLPGTRELVVIGTPYLIVYTAHRAEITILTLLDCRTDWMQKLHERGIESPKSYYSSVL